MKAALNKKSREKIISYLSQTGSNNIQDYTIFHTIINWKYKIKTFFRDNKYSKKVSDFEDTLL